MRSEVRSEEERCKFHIRRLIFKLKYTGRTLGMTEDAINEIVRGINSPTRSLKNIVKLLQTWNRKLQHRLNRKRLQRSIDDGSRQFHPDGAMQIYPDECLDFDGQVGVIPFALLRLQHAQSLFLQSMRYALPDVLLPQDASIGVKIHRQISVI